MSGKHALSFVIPAVCVVMIALATAAPAAQAYRICTFKGTVVDNGWRSMTVKSGAQCAEVNVGWRTKYVPNRRPCLGERVAVDFVLEDGYMKATKVVSLSPMPEEARCYPPAPPSASVCRTSRDEGPAVDTCPPPKAECSPRPPAHVADPAWSPTRRVAPPASKPSGKKPSAEKKETDKATVSKIPAEPKEEPRDRIPTDDKSERTLSGEVVHSSPKSLSIRVMQEGEAAELVNVKVGLKTRFMPFRRPAVGEKVKVEYRQENGDKFGYTVQVIQ